MKILICFVFWFIYITLPVQAQTTAWSFNTDGNSQGWNTLNNLSGAVTGGNWLLTIQGGDPYLVSPDNLNIPAADYNTIYINLQNKQASGRYQIFWTTTTDAAWTQSKSIFFNIPLNETVVSLHVFSMTATTWTGTIKQIRIDPGEGQTTGTIYVKDIQFVMMPVMELDNGSLHLKLDMTRGGAISYISKSGSARSIVNIADEGRYIQQSYYAGQAVNRQTEGQSPSWSPWSWNPIQVGDAYRNRAKILDYSKTNNMLYVKCIPMQWDMNNMAAEAEMEQWSALSGNNIHVKCRLTCHRTDNIYKENIINDQELPAVYPISALKNLYTYLGNAPFTGAPMDNPAVVNLSSGFWGVYNNVSEHWMAFVDDSQWGMGIYNAKCLKFLAGMAGSAGYEAMDGSTSYIAPVHRDIINKNIVYEYEYDIVIGTLQEIRQFVYALQAVSVEDIDSAKEDGFIMFPNPVKNELQITKCKLQMNNDKPFEIQILDIQGRVIKAFHFEHTTFTSLDISGLDKGIYFIKISEGEKTYVKKLVKD